MHCFHILCQSFLLSTCHSWLSNLAIMDQLYSSFSWKYLAVQFPSGHLGLLWNCGTGTECGSGFDTKYWFRFPSIRTLSAQHPSPSEPSWSPPWTWGLSSWPGPAWSSCQLSLPGFSFDHSWLPLWLTSSSPVWYGLSTNFQEFTKFHLKVCLMLMSPHSKLSGGGQERLYQEV